MEQAVTPLRFRSQAFSTSQRFPGKSEPHGLVSCRCRSWGCPFRVFPSQESRTPLEAASSPVVIHRRSTRRLPVRIAAGFLDIHARARQPDSPDDYGLPFHAPRSTLPGCPGSERRDSCVPTSFTHLEALFLLRVRSRRRESPHDERPILSWVCLSRVFSAHAWEPRTRPGLTTRACLRPRAPARSAGPEDPATRVRPLPNKELLRERPLGRFRSPSRPARAASSAATPSPSALRLGAEAPRP
jgi:hypothetical protein